MALLHNQPWQHAFHFRASGIGIFHSALDDFDHLLPHIPTPVHNRAKDVQVGGRTGIPLVSLLRVIPQAPPDMQRLSALPEYQMAERQRKTPD